MEAFPGSELRGELACLPPNSFRPGISPATMYRTPFYFAQGGKMRSSTFVPSRGAAQFSARILVPAPVASLRFSYSASTPVGLN